MADSGRLSEESLSVSVSGSTWAAVYSSRATSGLELFTAVKVGTDTDAGMPTCLPGITLSVSCPAATTTIPAATFPLRERSLTRPLAASLTQLRVYFSPASRPRPGAPRPVVVGGGFAPFFPEQSSVGAGCKILAVHESCS